MKIVTKNKFSIDGIEKNANINIFTSETKSIKLD